MSVAKYIVHESPVGRASSNYLVMVDLEAYGFAGTLEQIWLRPLDSKAYEVSCIPFRVYGLALNDVVELDADGKKVVGVVRRSGHRVFRVLLTPLLSVSKLDEVRNSVTGAIIDDALKAEWSGDRHVAVDVPPNGWDKGPRFRGTGGPHSGIEPPIYYPRGGGRGIPAEGENLPRGY
ncbi:DUF4265 domain-containing protein [Natronosporangium hydrolyticum]|uniref:DUF4265 domain-containing protein n=1 Tax=Natronosporangium hydrolyticum TaxID=2811111 RepID=A0A895Y774_9ACTN|nr:DUF4265 domain-containing protein [Natronosporangium hydrolyticum]QSB13577.1 DUF4265 domain-containing protein [Natronosporangium hydrolyticum]